MRIRARAIRRCGELLKEVEKAQPGPKELRADSGPQLSGRKSAATAAGLSERHAKDAIRVANIPGESFEQQIESDNPPTITSLAEQGKGKGVPHYVQQGMTKKGVFAFSRCAGVT